MWLRLVHVAHGDVERGSELGPINGAGADTARHATLRAYCTRSAFKLQLPKKETRKTSNPPSRER
eukprot:5528230-Prymnesium_polylepis.1